MCNWQNLLGSQMKPILSSRYLRFLQRFQAYQKATVCLSCSKFFESSSESQTSRCSRSRSQISLGLQFPKTYRFFEVKASALDHRIHMVLSLGFLWSGWWWTLMTQRRTWTAFSSPLQDRQRNFTGIFYEFLHFLM